jgi:hypothetical protein
MKKFKFLIVCVLVSLCISMAIAKEKKEKIENVVAEEKLVQSTECEKIDLYENTKTKEKYLIITVKERKQIKIVLANDNTTIGEK